MSYREVGEALDRGVEPEMICQTCPWDRLCINPPTMTRAEVHEKTAPPAKDEVKEDDGSLIKGLMSIALFAGKDSQAAICPVLAVRLRSQDGKVVADTIRGLMVAAPVTVE